jgi:hypothetical protein
VYIIPNPRFQDRYKHNVLCVVDTDIVAALTERTNDELLDAREASRRMGYSTRRLDKNADSLPFTIRQKSGKLRFSKHGLDEYLRNHRKPA